MLIIFFLALEIEDFESSGLHHAHFNAESFLIRYTCLMHRDPSRKWTGSEADSFPPDFNGHFLFGWTGG